MFDLSLPKLLVLTVIALVVFGPDKLPTIASQVGRALRDLRQIAEGAKNDLREGLGPEFSGFDIEDLNPKRLVHKHLFDGPHPDHGAQQQPARQRRASHAGRAPAVRPERDLSREFLNSRGAPGSILVSATSAGASALAVTPVAASREARKWVSPCSPALDAA